MLRRLGIIGGGIADVALSTLRELLNRAGNLVI